jgi:hypothetical protein
MKARVKDTAEVRDALMGNQAMINLIGCVIEVKGISPSSMLYSYGFKYEGSGWYWHEKWLTFMEFTNEVEYG